MKLTPNGYIPKGNVPSLTAEVIESLEDKVLLKAAAHKIEHFIPPHVLSDERWTVKPSAARVIDYNHYGTLENFLRNNLHSEWRYIKILRKSITDFPLFSKLNMYLNTVERVIYGDDQPDVTMDINLFHWAEHGEFSALFSPLVVETLYPVLLSESRLIARGKTPDATTRALVTFSKAILHKKIWGETELQEWKPKRHEQRWLFLTHEIEEINTTQDLKDLVRKDVEKVFLKLMGYPRRVGALRISARVRAINKELRQNFDLTKEEFERKDHERTILKKFLAYEKSF